MLMMTSRIAAKSRGKREGVSVAFLQLTRVVPDGPATKGTRFGKLLTGTQDNEKEERQNDWTNRERILLGLQGE